MTKSGFQSVDHYIASHPVETQVVLQRVRQILGKAVPGAEEVISYQIAALKKHGTYVVYFAGWKKHYSLYPVRASVDAAFKAALLPYERSKGTVRFPLSEPVPAKLIAGIAKALAKEAKERAMAKLAKATAKRTVKAGAKTKTQTRATAKKR
jgi:uncharacterized protein YdhG (YjbR/CyaY superfamily)